VCDPALSAYYPEDDYLDGVWDTIQLALEQVPNPHPSHRAIAMQDGEHRCLSNS
jgi:hypothetical protein